MLLPTAVEHLIIRWSFILMKAIQYAIEGNYGIEIGTPGLYLRVHQELKLFQALACLEVRDL